VIGRVRELEIESHSLPLLFLRGGYGHFAPLSMAVNDAAFSEHLRIVDLARGEMDQAAAALDCQVVAMSIVGHELVLLASAGRPDDPTWSTAGQCYPAIAPIGFNIMAWQEPDQIESWLSGVESVRQRQTYLRRLEQARQRGYSVMMESPHRSHLTQMVGQHRLPSTYAEMSAEQRQTVAGLPIDPLDFSAEQACEVRRIYVPVFGVNGTAPISLGVRLTHPLDSPQRFKCFVRHMQEVSDRVTESIGGRKSDEGLSASPLSPRRERIPRESDRAGRTHESAGAPGRLITGAGGPSPPAWPFRVAVDRPWPGWPNALCHLA
jgi:hypothetical protein